MRETDFGMSRDTQLTNVAVDLVCFNKSKN